MKRPMQLSLPTFLALSFCIASFAGEQCKAGVINPSFETGDMIGWTVSGDFAIADDGGSDGTYYLKNEPVWSFSPSTLPGIPDQWYWQAHAHQLISIPHWVSDFSIDIRTEGSQQYGVTLTHSVHTGTDTVIDFFVDVIAEGSSTPLPNGFVRYAVDISEAAGLQDIGLSINASEYSEDIPEDTVVLTLIIFNSYRNQ